MLFISLLAATATACGNSTDSSTSGDGGNGGGVGTQSSALRGHVAKGSGSDVAEFGGPSAVASTSQVSAVTIDATGKPVSVAKGSVDANGSYSLDVPVGDGPTILEALDAKGNVVARAILENARVDGAKLTVQPMTTESSVEAAVLLEMAGAGSAISGIDAVGLRARIDSATATVVHDHAADQVSEAKADIKALASAALAAQASQQAFLESAGIKWTAFATGELAAANTLTAALDKSESASAEANADFTSALAALEIKLGLDAAAAANGAMDASATAREALDAESASNDLTNAFARTQAMVESAAASAAMTEAFTKANASATVMEALQAADTELVTHVAAATDGATLESAFDTWRLAVRGTKAGVGGILATALGAVVTAKADYTTTVTAITSLEEDLQAKLDASAADAETQGTIDAAKLAAIIAKAYASFDASVQSKMASSALDLSAKDRTLMTSVFIGSEGTFQGGASGIATP